MNEMMNEIFIRVVMFALTLLVMIVWHEMGHYVMAIFLGLRPRMNWSLWNPHVAYTYTYVWQRQWIAFAGIVAGLVPWFRFAPSLGFVFGVGALVSYVGGLSSDFKDLGGGRT